MQRKPRTRKPNLKAKADKLIEAFVQFIQAFWTLYQQPIKKHGRAVLVHLVAAVLFLGLEAWRLIRWAQRFASEQMGDLILTFDRIPAADVYDADGTPLVW
jgi:hypothetical protein